MKTTTRSCITTCALSLTISSAALADQKASNSGALEQVTVTAQKREERLQDVPVPVTALTAASLVEQNQVRLQDYYASVPGLSLSYSGGLGQRGGAPALSIRGLTTGGGNPTVGITVDDVPYGSSSALGGGGTVPDLDPSDLARVEILRGPQGTLYGASSIGGQIKFVTVDPSTDGVSGRIQAGTSSVRNGDGLGYSARGSVNVPVGETFAVRASGFTRRDAGYIDNPVYGIDGVNRVDTHGGRLSALWKPSTSFSLKLSALVQDTQTDGSAMVFVRPDIADLQQDTLRGSGRSDRKSQVYSATLNATLAGIDLTAVSGYSINDVASSADQTPPYGAIADLVYGVSGAQVDDHNKTTKFTQEIRVGVPLGERIQWLLGAFYTDEDNRFAENLPAVNAVTGAQPGSILVATFPTTYSEYAAFTDLTFNVTDRFDIQFGGREGKNRQTYTETDSGPLIDLFLGGSPLFNPRVDTRDSSFTYLVTPRFRFSRDLMVYARVASGYRPGGPNPTSTVFGLPESFAPDKTDNYEIGIKGDLFAHSFSFDASIYYVDWKDIQLSLSDPTTGAGFYGNASRARSKGIELSVKSRPLQSLEISASLALNDAELKQDLPTGGAGAAIGLAGDRLPGSARFSGFLSIEQGFTLTENLSGFVAGSISYVGERMGTFLASPQRQVYPAYAQTDARVGVTREAWTANLFINNVADRRGALAGGLGTIFPAAFYYIQPRTIGVSLAKEF